MGDPDSYVGNYELQVPIFVVTHHPPAVPPKQDEHLTFTFVTEGVEAAGLVDELRVDIMPVVLGSGLRLLENLDAERLRLEKLEVREIGARTSLGFRIVTG